MPQPVTPPSTLPVPRGAPSTRTSAPRGPIAPERGLFDYRPFWAKRFGIAPFLPRTRAEMDALGWEACDVVIVTGDAYVDHPSFGMAIVGRLLEAHGFRVGILDQPSWQSADAFRELGAPTLYFGVTAGNMDSLVNHYTSDKKPRRDDAYTPGGAAGARPDRATIVYTQRCREAFPNVPVMIGGIEASLRRLSHYDYWTGKVRRSLLIDSGADILLYGNAERALVEVTHRAARGEHLRDILDVRGTVVRRACGSTGPVDAPGTFAVERSDRIDPVGAIDPVPDPYATEEEMRERGQTANAAESGGQTDGAAPSDGQTLGGEAGAGGGRALAAERSAPKKPPTLIQLRRKQKELPRSHTVLRLPSWHEVKEDRALYAHTSRVFHLEANPHNARTLVQRNGDVDVWQNPPPIPLTTEEMDGVYDLPYQKVPHPAHQAQKIPAYDMIRFSVTVMRGCFGGCSFCSITEHEGRIIQSRSEASVLREVEGLKRLPGFTGSVSDLGGPTANMYRIACKSREIEAACRKPSCVYPGVCPNLNTSHQSLIQLYRKARAIPGIKKISIASGLRYDLAVEDPEYVKELVTHHVGGYLKIAPEHVAEGPLSKMMKPGMGAYERFKELFERYSKAAGKKQYLIPYFIAAHPGTTNRDMLELALWLKRNGFEADQVQAFLPGPMSYSAAMYHTGKNPLRPVKRDSEEVYSAKTPEERRLHKAFLRYHDPKNWPLLDTALRKMGRTDLIGHGPGKLIPNGYREKPGMRGDGTRTSERVVRGGARPTDTGARPAASSTRTTGAPGNERGAVPRGVRQPGTTFVTQRTGMAQFAAARPGENRSRGKRQK